MSSPEIQWKPLGQLKIPGTYNSTAYKFDRIISPMLEKGVDKLVNPRIVGQAPSDHRLDDTNNIFIGQQAYDDLIDHITLLSQAHDESKTLKSSSKMSSRNATMARQKPGNGSPISHSWFTEVPSNGEEVAHILLNTFDPDACIKNLRHTAYERNAEVSAVLSHENTPWRYMVDWYTDCKGVEQSEELPVERIIQANRLLVDIPRKVGYQYLVPTPASLPEFQLRLLLHPHPAAASGTFFAANPKLQMKSFLVLGSIARQLTVPMFRVVSHVFIVTVITIWYDGTIICRATIVGCRSRVFVLEISVHNLRANTSGMFGIVYFKACQRNRINITLVRRILPVKVDNRINLVFDAATPVLVIPGPASRMLINRLVKEIPYMIGYMVTSSRFRED
ncbi:hypothetical protein IWW34DRAFT_825509 [Fusarium oxysporum f. sp. albedinis]|nr:hypothetical protein IWW34DRAFT_825509 [Fusarium oxysporum f. sp. albedinis]